MSTTTNYGLTKPTVGGRDSTWGNTLNANFDLLDTTIANTAMPVGGIIMWSGTIATIPTGWALCDGTNGTPNLTGRFVVHADADSSGTYNVGASGGSADVTLTASQVPQLAGTTDSQGAHTHSGSSTASAGAHTHSYTDNYVEQVAQIPGIDIDYNSNTFNQNGSRTGTTASAGAHTHTLSITSDGAHTHTTTVNSGGGSAHENRPPYYALAYIMKLAV